MNFLHPGIAIAGAAAVALPIVIHLLFRRRRIPLDWAAMDLLREAVRRMNRKLRLEQWTVLALRALAVLFVGLGLAVPFIGKAGVFDDRGRVWIVVVDDGLTSGVRTGASDGRGEAEIERVKDEAARILAERGARDRAGIVLASSPPRVLLMPTGDPEQFARALDTIDASESPSDVRGALQLARESALQEGVRVADVRIVLASAFRLGSIPSSEDGVLDSSPRGATNLGEETRVQVISLAPARDAPVDVRVRSVEARPAPSGGLVAVRAVLMREGGSLEEQTTEVRATGDGFATPASRRVTWERGQAEAVVEFQLTAMTAGASDARRAAIEVRIADDALQPGNASWTVVDVRSEVDVGVVGRRGTLDAADLDKVPASLWISRALSPSIGSGMRVRDIDPSSCDARALVGLDAVVVARPDLLSTQSCDEIGAFVRAGGVAVIVPSGESRAQSWAGVLLSRLGVPFSVAAEAIDLAQPLLLAEEQPPSRLLATLRPELSSLVAPVTVDRLVPIEGHDVGDVVLSFADGTPLLVARVPAENAAGGRALDSPDGLILLFAVAPELSWTNLPVKPLMVPLFQEIVRTALQISASRGNALVGERIRANAGVQFRGSDDRVTAIGSDGVSVEPIRRAGILRGEDGSMIAVNHEGASLSLVPRTEDDVRLALRDLGVFTFRSIGPAPSSSDGLDAVGAQGGARDVERSRLAFVALVLAMAALLFEGFLSRMFSHASMARAGSIGGVVSTIGRIRPRSSAPQRLASESREPIGGRR
jgi:hypothetical protein